MPNFKWASASRHFRGRRGHNPRSVHSGPHVLVGIHHKYLARGPKTASTFHHGNVLVTLMQEVLTEAEKSLTQTDQVDAVSHIRQLFQQTMESDFREAVERLTGRKVLAFISGNHIDPDIAAELFILNGPPGTPDAAA